MDNHGNPNVRELFESLSKNISMTLTPERRTILIAEQLAGSLIMGGISPMAGDEMPKVSVGVSGNVIRLELVSTGQFNMWVDILSAERHEMAEHILNRAPRLEVKEINYRSEQPARGMFDGPLTMNVGTGRMFAMDEATRKLFDLGTVNKWHPLWEKSPRGAMVDEAIAREGDDTLTLPLLVGHAQNGHTINIRSDDGTSVTLTPPIMRRELASYFLRHSMIDDLVATFADDGAILRELSGINQLPEKRVRRPGASAVDLRQHQTVYDLDVIKEKIVQRMVTEGCAVYELGDGRTFSMFHQNNEPWVDSMGAWHLTGIPSKVLFKAARDAGGENRQWIRQWNRGNRKVAFINLYAALCHLKDSQKLTVDMLRLKVEQLGVEKRELQMLARHAQSEARHAKSTDMSAAFALGKAKDKMIDDLRAAFSDMRDQRDKAVKDFNSLSNRVRAAFDGDRYDEIPEELHSFMIGDPLVPLKPTIREKMAEAGQKANEAHRAQRKEAAEAIFASKLEERGIDPAMAGVVQTDSPLHEADLEIRKEVDTIRERVVNEVVSGLKRAGIVLPPSWFVLDADGAGDTRG